MRFSTALDGSLPALWLHMAQTICKKSLTQETSFLHEINPSSVFFIFSGLLPICDCSLQRDAFFALEAKAFEIPQRNLGNRPDRQPLQIRGHDRPQRELVITSAARPCSVHS